MIEYIKFIHKVQKKINKMFATNISSMYRKLVNHNKIYDIEEFLDPNNYKLKYIYSCTCPTKLIHSSNFLITSRIIRKIVK